MDQTLPLIQKHTSGEAPKACSVCTITWSQRRSAIQLAADATRVRRSSRPSEPEACTQPAHVTLVDTSVYLKPAELLDVALDMLARLAPCLNLGVGELRHKDLLDTIGADNCRK